MNRFFTAKHMALILLLMVMSLLAAACSGNDGARGPAGPAGSGGAAGPAGADGSDGAAGLRGAAGSNGSAGSAGADGAAGGPGPSGPPGNPGVRGPSGADGESTTAGVSLSSQGVSAGGAVDVAAYLTGFASGESITVTLMFPDGSSSAVGTATAGSSGIASVSVTSSGLDAGVYGVVAEGNLGGKASAALVSK